MENHNSSHHAPGLCLDMIAQTPFLNKLYTQITSCFATSNAVPDEAIITTLRLGLERLGDSVPWVAGQVLRNEPGLDCSCDFSIVPWAKAPRLVVKDLRDDSSAPTMEHLRAARFPMRLLDESMLSPCKTLSFASDITPYVFVIQATFIRGGLLLTFVAQHNTMDMVGQTEIMRLLSKACNGEAFTREEVSNGNTARHDIVPYFEDSWEPGPELDSQRIMPPRPQSAPPKCTWAYFGFPSDSLAALKAQASEAVISSAGYISTDDTLSAFIWRCVSRVRLDRLEPTARSTFARAVDVRQFLGASTTYPGLLQNMTYNALTVADAASIPLGVVASHLRSSLDPTDISYRTRALATALHRWPDKAALSFTASVDASTGLSFSSWGKISLFNLDFNLGLGKPEAVRRPRFDAVVESLMYVMPWTPDGELVVGMCLRDEDLEALRADEEFTRYGTYIG